MLAHLFIDATYLVKATESSRIAYDFRKLISYLECQVGASIEKIRYYTAILNTPENKESKQRQMDWISDRKAQDHRFIPKIKEVMTTTSRDGTEIKRQVGVDTQLAIDVVDSLYLDRPDSVLLLAGDGDFISVIERIQAFLIDAVLVIVEDTSITQTSRVLYCQADKVVVLTKELFKSWAIYDKY